MAKPTNPVRMKSQDYAVRLTRMMHEANELGFHATARLINEATRKLGWEIAAKLDKETKDE